MATSYRRLNTHTRRSRPMSLRSQIDQFLNYHRAVGHSPLTVLHYAESLRLLERCLVEAGIEPSTESLTNTTMTAFRPGCASTPTRGWRGSTERSIYGTHGALVDTKAFVRWLAEEGILDRVPKFPSRNFPNGYS